MPEIKVIRVVFAVRKSLTTIEYKQGASLRRLC